MMRRKKFHLYSQGWDAFVNGHPFEPLASNSWRHGYSDAHVVEAQHAFADPQSSHSRYRAFAAHPQGNPHWQHIDDMEAHYRQGRTRYRAVLFDIIMWFTLFMIFIVAVIALTNMFIGVRVPPVTYHNRFGDIEWTWNSNRTTTTP